MHEAAVARGAVFEDVGLWKRARYFPQGGEDLDAAVARECRAVRTSCGVFDASTLGKIAVIGPDAAEFLNRLYVNDFSASRRGVPATESCCARMASSTTTASSRASHPAGST
jgi:sarcosine oxidase subunit alpha